MDKYLIIVGAGAAATIVDGNDAGSVVFVYGEIEVAISGMTITNGVADYGAGIYIEGAAMGATVSIDGCVVAGNAASTQGGGLAAYSSAVDVRNSTFSGNTVPGSGAGTKGGGGVSVIDGELTAVNSTFTGNSAKNGGGIYVSGSGVSIEHATVYANSAGTAGGGLYVSGSSVGMANSIVAGNTAPSAANVYGSLVSDLNNLSAGDPVLAVLADNGGPTPTHKLLPGSPAINAGMAGTVAFDQRGVPRAQGNAPDIGAYEVVYIAHVDDGYTSSACGGHVWNVDAFTTIQAGVNAVAVSGTVHVAAGTYAENLDLAKPVALLGPNADISPNTGTRVPEAVIDPPGTGNNWVGRAIKIATDDVTIKGFKVTGVDSDAAIVSGYGSYGINTENVLIEKILFADITASAIYTMSVSGQCSNWTVTDNRIQNVANGATPNSGMNLWDQSNLICTYNEILNVGYAGIQLGGGVGVTTATVQYNKITNVAQQGIQIANACSDILVADNLINGANLIQDPDKGGIRLYGADYTGAVTIRNNTISNSFNGIAVKDGQNIDGKQITVIANNIANNTQAGIYNGGTGTLAASGNWWGSASGPTSPDNPGGTGTAVSGLVDFLPFYTEVALENLAPYGLVLAPATVAENTAAGFAVGTLATTDDDTGDTFTYTLVAGIGDTGNGFFTIDGATLKTSAALDFETQPTLSVRIRTTDSHVNNAGAYDEVFTITVTDVNDAPVLAPIGPRIVNEDELLAFSISASDPDNDELAYTWQDVPAWATAAGTSFAGTPTQADVGTYNLTVTVTDGSLTDSENFTLTVAAVNDNPTVANALPDLNRQQDFATFTIPLAPVFADAENDTLAYSVAADGVVGASVDGSTLTLSSIAGNRGTATVTVTATETATPEKLAVSDTFTVTVKPVWNTTRNTFFDTIQVAIADAGTLAGDVISVAAGTYEPPVCITVAKNLVLQGPPCEPSSGLPEVTISGNGAHRIFEVSAGCTLNLKNLAIANGSGSYGGAISASGSLRAEACLFIDNVSSGYGSAIAAQCGQGCVLFLTNCTFAANTQTGSGGGGAVYVTNGKDNGSAETDAEIYDCVFVSNTTATCSASALMVNASNAKVADCTFQYNSSMSAVFADNGGDIEFSGCRFDHNAGANGTVYFASENTCTFTACDFTLNTVSGASINGGGAIYCSGVAKIVGCAFVSNRVESAAGKGGGALVFGSGSSCSVVTGCVFVANGLAGSGSGTSIFVSKGSAAATLVTLSANYWNDGGFPTISSTDGSADIYYQMAGGGSSAVVESFYADLELTDLRYCVVYVDDDFTEATEGWGLNRFKTVQGGVDAVAAGGTVHVAAGTYAGATLTKSVNLLGSNAGIAGYGIRADESVISSVVNMTGNGTSVLIDGFKFAVTPYLMFGKNDAASKQTADWIFQNNLVEASGAIYSEVGQVNLNWRDVVVTRNRFVNMTSDAVITHNVRSLTATDNQFDTLGAGGNALVCQNIGSLTVAGNTFTNIGWNAVQLVGATSVTITNNVCGNLGAEAFKLGGPIVNGVCSYNTIVGANTANEVDVGGIRIRVAAGQPYNVEIIGNYIENSYNGLAVRNGDDLDGTSITVAQNTFVDNSHAGVYNGSDDTLTVSENYWGTAFGPSGAGFFGTGDAIIGPVAIENYYTDAALTTLHYFDLYVDDNGIEDATHFLTIEAAYAAANPGDTIHVAAGGYTLDSTFTVAKPGLTITGESSASVTIDASARTGTAYGIHVAASDVTIEHFTLIPAGYEGAGFPIHVSGTPGILSNITLRDIVIADSYRTPFDFNGVDNLVLDTLVASGADYGSGIGLSGCVGVTITGCQTADNAWGGVRVSGSTDVEPDRASSDINVDFAANTFAEVNALYIDVDGMGSTVDATGYSYKITTSAGTTTYLEEGYTEAQAIAVALGVESTFPGLTVTGLYEADGDPVLFDGEMSTAVVYVDDNWTNAVPGQGIPKPGAPGTYLQFGRNAFDTVQGGANGVAVAGTVHVANGLYKESNTTLSKPMTLEGETRSGVVIAPAAEDENLTTGGFTGVYQHGFVIAASDVTVTNLTIDGKANAALTEGKCNFRAGVMANGDIHSNVILASLTVRNTYLYGINMRIGTIGQGGAGSAIRSCWVENMGFNAYPSYGIYSTHAGVIAGNTVTNAGYRGIYVYSANMDVYDNTVWTGDYDPVYGSEGVCIVGDVNGNLSPAPVTRVYRNTIHVRNNVVKGIGMNVLYGLSSTFIGGDSLEDGNVIRLDGGSAADDGIECWWTKTGQPVIQNNTVYADNEDSAVWMFINRSKTEPVDAAAPIFKGNRFYATNSDGTVPGRGTAVFMTDDMRFFGDWMDGACYAILKGNLIDGFARGIDLYRSGDGPEDYDEREHTVQAVIGGANPADANTIQNCGVGVRLFVHPDAYDGPLAKVCDATILGNTTTFAGNDIAILIDGGSASVSQNGLYDNGIAIQAINGGSLTALDENTFEGGATHDDNGTDLLISATAGSVTIGTGNAFAGDLNFIDNRSVQNFDLTANSTTFDVADPYAIEDLVYHKVDEAACGLVRYAANKIYVTQSSGSIQRGIDAASAGDTVHVGAGTYLEQVTIAKALTVIGLDGAVLDGTGLGTTAVGVRIKSGNVTFDNVDVVSYQGNGIICGYEASIPGGLPNICIVNCRIADIQPGNSHGFGIYVGYESEGFGYVPPKLTAHLDYSGLLIASNEIVNTKCSGLVLQSITGTPGSLVVCDNNIHGITANSGIWVDCARNLVIEGNTVAGNKWGIEFSAYAEFGTLNGPYGPRDIVVRNNFVSGNAQQGLALYEGWPSTIAITQNSITGNGTGLQNYLDATVSAENNWWGNQTGPASTANPGGLGDTVVGSVDFSSWLGDGTDSSTAPGFQPNLTPVYYLPLGLKFTASPANAALGGSLGTVTVQVTNELGAVAAQFTGDVALAIGSQPGSGVLTGTLTKPCAAGEVSFSDLAVTVDGGTGFTLAASAAPPIAGAVSAAFDIANPLPELGSMSPIFAAAGSGDLTLTLSGSAFVGSSVVKWGAAETVLVPASVTADSMTVTVPAALLTTAGTAAVKVFSPAEGGGTSDPLTFTITTYAQAPEVWVDDGWTGYGYCGGKTWGYDAFRTIQSAVNGVAVGGTIHVLAGLYEEDVDLNKANLSVLGAGAEAVTVMGQIGGIGQTVKFSAEGILLDGLTITRDGNTVEEWTLALNDAGIHIQGQSSGTVRNCRITGMRTAIDINASSNLTIRNNDIMFNRTGMILRNTTDNLTVVENKITDNWTVGVLFLDASGGDNDPIQRAANCTFSNNAIFGNWYGDIVDRQTAGSLPAPGANLKNFSGNWLGTVTPVVATVNSTEPGYAVQIPVAYGGEASNPGGAPNILGTASANIDYSPWLAVGTDTDNGALGFKGDFDTLWVDDDSPQAGTTGHIHEGVDLVIAGGTVNVAAGTYALSQEVNLNKAITLLGPNATISPNTGVRVSEAILSSPTTACFNVPYYSTDAITIKGFTFASVVLRAHWHRGVITFEKNRVVNPEGKQDIAFYVSGGDDVLAAGNTVVVHDNLFSQINAGLNGTAVWLRLNGPGSLGTVTDNVIDTTSYGGINIEGANNYAYDGANVVVTGNRVKNTQQQGIQVALKIGTGLIAENEVENANLINGADRGGIRMYGTYFVGPINIMSNIVSGSGNGIAIKNSENIAGKPITVAFNNLAGNSNAAIYNGGTGTLSAENNWFGSATGPDSDLNAGGTGAAVVGAVDFSPWLGTGAEDPLTGAAIGFQPVLTTVYYLPLGLKFTAQPGNANLGGSLGTVTVQVTNELGTMAAQFAGDVRLAIASQPGHGVLTGTLTNACVAGVVSFADLAVTVDGGTGFKLAASAATPIAGATSAAFNITNPAPVLGSMSPIFKAAGSGDLTLTLSGSAFVKSSVVKWGATETVLVPSAVTADSITVTVPAALLTTAGTAAVKVFSPAEGGGTSAPLTFTITATALAPVVWVDNDWTGYGDCGGHVWGYDAFKTIQSAVNGVAVNGTVNVLSGTYAETVTTGKIVNYVGAADGSGGGLPTVLGSISISVPSAPDAASRIENIHFKVDTAVCLTLQNVDGGVTVSNCTFNGDGKFKNAIDLNSGGNGNFLTVEDSVFTNGLYLAINGTAKEVTVRRTLISGVKSGINTQSGETDLVVEDCEITVAVQGAASSSYGVRFSSTTAGAGHNLTVTGSRIVVDPNGFAINPAEHRAIWIRSGASGALTVADSLIGGYVANETPGTLDGSGNWWGGADAATVTAKILAGTAGTVDYSPWLAVGTDTDGGALGFKGDFSALYVDDNSPQAGAVGYIQEGVNLATAGGTVNVLAGAYTEQVLIGKALQLLGAGKDVTTIVAPAVRTGTLTQSKVWDYIVAADASTGLIDVRIEGFTVDANGQPKTAGTDGLIGVFLRDVAGATAGLFDATVKGFGTTAYESWAVRAYGAASALTIADNTLSDYTRDGIVVSEALATVSGNTLAGSAITLNGISLQDVTAGVVTNNTVAGHARSAPWAACGIIVWDSTGVLVTGNQVSGNFYGVCLEGADSGKVIRNTLTGNIKRGFSLNDADNNVVTANTISGPLNGSDDTAIGLANGSTGNLIGGATLAEGNIITLATSGTGNLYAVYVQGDVGAGSNTIQYNTITGGRRGVQVDSGNSGTTMIAYNAVTGAGSGETGGGRGIAAVGDATHQPVVIARFNEIRDNGFAGIDLGGDVSMLSLFENNMISNNWRGIESSSPVTVAFNAIVHNVYGGVITHYGSAASEATIAASNWWGAATGPWNAANPGGQGNAVNNNNMAPIDFSPWLGSGADGNGEERGFVPTLAPLYYLPVGIKFSTEPAGALLGAALATQPRVTVTNEIGEVATQFNGSIALAIGVNPGVPVAGEMTGTAAVTVTNSVAIFDGLSIVKGTGNGYTLVATTLGLPAVTSAAFNILNSTPVLTDVADWTTGEQSAPSAFLAQATDTAADLVAQTLTFSLVCTSEGSMPEGITFDTATGAFSWQTVESQGGRSYTFELTVTDDGTGPLSASDTFTVTVNEVNVAPVIDIEDTSLEVDEEPAQALTFTATATDQDRVPFQALTFSLAAVAGQTYPAGAAIVTTDAGDGTASGAFSWTPTEAQGGSNYVVDVVVTDNGANPMSLAATQRVTIAVAEVNVAPVLDTIPPQSAVFGQTLTFTATATDHDLPAQTLTYSLDGEPDGAVIDPASGVFTWTPTEAQAQGNFSFTVTVTDDGLNEDALSDSQTVTIGAIAAEQFCPGFRSPSTSMVVSNSLTFGGTLTDLTWTPVLPAGWTVLAASAVGGNGVAATNGLGGVVFTTLPATSPVDFTYTVGVPGNTAVSNAVGAVVSFNGLTAAVAPITVYRYHSADYRADISGEFVGQFRKIDSTEINRVLAYWRYGYKPDAAGYDGFVAMPGYTGEGGRHSADYQTPYWVIDTDEASLVQEYWRAGGYHADATTVDGYAYDRAGPGPSPLGGFSILALPLSIPLPPVVSMAAPESYDPGQSVTVTSTFLNNSTEKLLRFIWRLDVPEGWRITGVSGDGLPELDTTGTNVLLLAGTLPTSQISLTLTLSVPLNETRAASVGCAASYKFYGMTDLATVTTSTTPMAPLDADADGLADAWAAAYGIDDPDGDPDGDRMTNLDEYLCGTIPTDETSYLRMVSVKPFPGRGVEISWSSEAGRVYTLQRAVGAPVGLVDFAADLPADPSGRNTYLDDTGLAAPCFYRVKLQQ